MHLGKLLTDLMLPAAVLGWASHANTPCTAVMSRMNSIESFSFIFADVKYVSIVSLE